MPDPHLSIPDTISQIFPEIKVIPEEDFAPFSPCGCPTQLLFSTSWGQLLLLLSYNHWQHNLYILSLAKKPETSEKCACLILFSFFPTLLQLYFQTSLHICSASDRAPRWWFHLKSFWLYRNHSLNKRPPIPTITITLHTLHGLSCSAWCWEKKWLFVRGVFDT